MPEKLPENIAELQRMIATSSKWPDGCIERASATVPPDVSEGDVLGTKTLVSASTTLGSITVSSVTERIGEIYGKDHYEVVAEKNWHRDMDFESFRASEWWVPSMRAFSDGDADCSKLYTEVLQDGDYVEIYKAMPQHYRDVFGNWRTSKNIDSAFVSIDGDGFMRLEFNGLYFEGEIGELVTMLHNMAKIRNCGIKVGDGEMHVPLR